VNSPVLVDSNVLLDIVASDRAWAEWSSAMLAQVGENAQLVINPIVYAEISVQYERVEDADAAFPTERFVREPIPYEAAFLAGKAYSLYRRRGGTRTSPLPDFFIGAHAAVAGYRLLTRDATRYRSYFPRLHLIAP
jgi:predicted nucleic acid-binding protein